jgi:hypothetical protein
MEKRALLSYGLIAAIIFAVADVAGALTYPGYSYLNQGIGELGAIDAPPHAWMTTVWGVYDLLLLAFGIGITAVSYRTSGLRQSGRLFIAIGAIGAATILFPAHARWDAAATADVVHLALTAAGAVLALLAVPLAAGALTSRFRAYSFATMLAMLCFGGVAAAITLRFPMTGFSQFLGAAERVAVGSWLAWTAVLAVGLVRAQSRDETLSELAHVAPDSAPGENAAV